MPVEETERGSRSPRVVDVDGIRVVDVVDVDGIRVVDGTQENSTNASKM